MTFPRLLRLFHSSTISQIDAAYDEVLQADAVMQAAWERRFAHLTQSDFPLVTWHGAHVVWYRTTAAVLGDLTSFAFRQCSGYGCSGSIYIDRSTNEVMLQHKYQLVRFLDPTQTSTFYPPTKYDANTWVRMLLANAHHIHGVDNYSVKE